MPDSDQKVTTYQAGQLQASAGKIFYDLSALGETSRALTEKAGHYEHTPPRLVENIETLAKQLEEAFTTAREVTEQIASIHEGVTLRGMTGRDPEILQRERSLGRAMPEKP